MDAERWWQLFVAIAATVWIGLFMAEMAVGYGVFDPSSGTRTSVRVGLRVLLIVFLIDLVLLYRWSEQNPRAFVRSNWFWIVTVVPWFRPLRLLRIGRGIRTLRMLAGSRRVGSFLNKLRRMGRRLWSRLNG